MISGCLPVTSRDTLLVAPGAAGHRPTLAAPATPLGAGATKAPRAGAASYSWGGGGGGVNGGAGAVGSQFAGPDVDTGGNGGGAGSSMIDAQAIHGTIETGTPDQNLDGTVKLTFAPQLSDQLTPSSSSVTAGGTVTVPLTGTTSDGQSFPLGVSGFTWSTKITPSQGDLGTAPDKVAGDQITMYQAVCIPSLPTSTAPPLRAPRSA